MSKFNTFWNLIANYKIEIPVIQRDYAQGRKEERVTAIRIDLIKDLLHAVQDKDNKQVHLGFIYGKIFGKDKAIEKDKNKKAIREILTAVEGYAKFLDLNIESSVKSIAKEDEGFIDMAIFIPLDGQQRLTTLFLLHWYLIQLLEGEEYSKHIYHLKKFSYKVRKTSSTFCEELCENKITNIKHSISEEIKNSTWFLRVWLRDPTIQGMLVTLDEIHKQVSQIADKKDLFKNLISDSHPKITFDFFDLDELNQTDELYVKMNARGRQLSDFEHFKAWLQNYVSINEKFFTENNNYILDNQWKFKIDKTWLDLFWRNSDNFYVDNTVYNAFKQIALLEYIALEKEPNEDFIKLIRDKKYISFKVFEEIKFFNKDTLKFLFRAFDLLSDRRISNVYSLLKDISCPPFITDSSSLGKYFISNNESVSMPETVYYYAFLVYICHDDFDMDTFEEDNFQNWMRITRNLIFNTYIQNPQNFIDSLKSIKKLSKEMFAIKSYLVDSSDKLEIDYFENRQIKQEVLKLRLIAHYDISFYDDILKFENHEYFNGDIGFIIDMASSINTSNTSSIELITAKEDFTSNFHHYCIVAARLFENSIRDHKKFILQRALLCKEDYFPEAGVNYTYCLSNNKSLRARRDNWQKLFNNEDKLIILKRLIDENLSNAKNIKSKLSQLIKNHTVTDWRKYFINCYPTFAFCNRGLIRFNNDRSIYLLRTSRIYGSHAELRSYYFYKKHFESHQDHLPTLKSNGDLTLCEENPSQINISPFNSLIYWENAQSSYDFPCIRMAAWEKGNHNFKLEITYKDDKGDNDENYYIRFYDKNLNDFSNDKEIKSLFDDWKPEKNFLYKTFQTESALMNDIFALLSELKQLES